MARLFRNTYLFEGLYGILICGCSISYAGVSFVGAICGDIRIDRSHCRAITDMEFVEQLQQMVDTLGQTRALQEELKQALEMKAKAASEEVVVVYDETIVEDSDFRMAAAAAEKVIAEWRRAMDLEGDRDSSGGRGGGCSDGP